MVDGFTRPVGLTHAGDGSGRLFVIEQAGVIWIIQDGARRPDPFIDLRDRVTDLRVEYDERGLLGLAFHPRFEDNGYFYVNYTDKNGDTVIARFSLSADPARGDLASEARLIFVDQPYSNHNGGWLDFGPDGYLYIGLGDGGNAGDPENNAQNPNTLLGKLLRIDVDGDQPYAIPPDNPFANGGGAPEIWALGLRNPWRCAFDRATGDLYIGDVGQGEWEEIDFLPWGAPVGVNFGWDFREGLHPYEGIPPEGMTFTDPIAEYPHNPDYSVSGGYVYRGVNLPDWQGVYFYGDFVSGRLWGLLRAPDGSWQNQLLYETRLSIASFGEDEAGEVYLVDYKGAIYQLGPN
jgi:glucose/arabinose dehydrogenase